MFFHGLIVNFFLILNDSIVWMYPSLFIHSLIEGQLGYLQFLAIVHKTAVYVHLWSDFCVGRSFKLIWGNTTVEFSNSARFQITGGCVYSDDGSQTHRVSYASAISFHHFLELIYFLQDFFESSKNQHICTLTLNFPKILVTVTCLAKHVFCHPMIVWCHITKFTSFPVYKI